MTNARAEDSGPFMCVSHNQAGRVEANFTLQVIDQKTDIIAASFCNASLFWHGGLDQAATLFFQFPVERINFLIMLYLSGYMVTQTSQYYTLNPSIKRLVLSTTPDTLVLSITPLYLKVHLSCFRIVVSVGK